MMRDIDPQTLRDARIVYATVLVNQGTDFGPYPHFRVPDVLRTDGKTLPKQALIFAQNRLTRLPDEGLWGRIEQEAWFALARFGRWSISQSTETTV